MKDYEFTNNWFLNNKNIWKKIIKDYSPRNILEIGCYEGQCTSFLIENCSLDSSIDIHCIDTWDFDKKQKIEERFDKNIRL